MGYSSQTFTAFQTSLKCILSFEALWEKKKNTKTNKQQNKTNKQNPSKPHFLLCLQRRCWERRHKGGLCSPLPRTALPKGSCGSDATLAGKLAMETKGKAVLETHIMWWQYISTSVGQERNGLMTWPGNMVLRLTLLHHMQRLGKLDGKDTRAASSVLLRHESTIIPVLSQKSAAQGLQPLCWAEQPPQEKLLPTLAWAGQLRHSPNAMLCTLTQCYVSNSTPKMAMLFSHSGKREQTVPVHSTWVM